MTPSGMRRQRVCAGTSVGSRVTGVSEHPLPVASRSFAGHHPAPARISLGAPAERVKRDYSLTLAPLKAEEGHVYLLGDNRDSSNDSRFIGQVPVSELTGKVTGIWYSADQERIGTTF